jgi:hypothetical protein
MIHRRGFLVGVFSAFAAPAIVRAGSIMPVKVMPVGLPIIGPYSELYEELTAITHRAFIPYFHAVLPQQNFRVSSLLTE